MLLAQFIDMGTSALIPLYPPKEARSIMLRLCEELLGVKSYTHVIEPLTEVPVENEAGLLSALDRLTRSEPLQYVLGYAWFCGRRFRVSPDVLIPRPETEILATDAYSYALSKGNGARVLDLCTGSGCIAWTIALNAPGSKVVATDISGAALDIARDQFRSPGPEFVLSDVLDTEQDFPYGPFDLVVSNPPYIMERERALMHGNVLDHEPALALFVPDSDPLIYYRAIARWCARLLVPGGVGMVEINESLPEQTQAAISAEGLTDCCQIKDFCNKTRFISFTKPLV